MIITISGKPGSGKTTIAKILAKNRNWPHYSSGDFFRDIAKRRGLTPLELNARIRTDPAIDAEIDKRTQELGQKKDNFVMDSRLAFLFIPSSFKVFLDIDTREAGKRIWKEKRESERENTTLNKTVKNLQKRLKTEVRDFKERYQIDYTNPKNFDAVIHTTHRSIPEILAAVETALAEWEDAGRRSPDAVKKKPILRKKR